MDNSQNNQPTPQENPSSTLFVSGLDSQMQDQDFASYFQNCPGVQGTRTKVDKRGNLIGFVDFDNEENAIAVRSRFDSGKFPALNNGNYSVHFARPSRVRSENLSRGGASSPSRSSNGGNNNNNNNNGGNNNNNNGARRSQGFGDNYNNNNNNGNRGGRGGQGYNNYNAMPYGGPYSNLGGVGNARLPEDASATLYVEGVPNDSEFVEREVSHIFRPFPGFQTVRTFQRESRKVSGTTYLLCFIEFDNPHLSTNAMQMLQGYKYDLRNKNQRGLRISYAVNSNNKQRNNNNNNGGGGDGGNGDEQNDQQYS